MRPQIALQKLGNLLMAPSFTTKEASQKGVSASTLNYYSKIGAIERLGHGLYRGKEAPKGNDFRFEDLIEAAMNVKSGVVCLTSALALYGLTEEIPRQHWIAIRNDTIHRGGGSIKVIRMRNMQLGVTIIDVGGISLRIFDRERTIVDSFRYLGQETAIKALREGIKLKGKSRLDLGKLKKYAKALRVKIDPFLLAITT